MYRKKIRRALHSKRNIGMLLGFLSVCTVSTAAARIKRDTVVQKIPPAVELKLFDPEHLPTPAPPLQPGREAETECKFNCDNNFQFDVFMRNDVAKHCWIVFRVTKVDTKISLPITMWQPASASERLKAYEDGHKRIAEIVYSTAGDVAQESAHAAIGHIFMGEGDTSEGAEQQALAKANNFVCESYRSKTFNIASEVSKIYDQLTNQVVASSGVEQAVQEAFDTFIRRN